MKTKLTDKQQKYIVFAENTTYYSLKVEANSAAEANKIAEQSDGGDWTEDSSGKWIVSEELTSPDLPLAFMSYLSSEKKRKNRNPWAVDFRRREQGD